MSVARRVGLGLGVVLVVVGSVILFVPTLAPDIDPSSGTLTAVGLVTLFLGGLAVRARLLVTDRRAAIPVPERRYAPPVPGDGFDGRLEAFASRGRLRGASERRVVRTRLETTAVAVLVRNGLSEGDAHDRLARGTWTDDPHAAAFFAEARASDVPLEDRLRAAFSSEPSGRRRARHAIDALSHIAAGEREP